MKNSESDRCSAAVFRCFHNTKIRIFGYVIAVGPISLWGRDLPARIQEPVVYVNSQNSFLSTPRTSNFLAIAAVSKARELVVVTVNQRHFSPLGVEGFNPFGLH